MSRTPARLVRTGLAATAIAAGTVLAAGVAAPAQAANVAQISCTGASGQITFNPGISQNARTERAVLTATLSGCSDFTGRRFNGTGSLSANLSGNAGSAAGTLSGTFTINWPADSGFNPSVGNATVNLATNTVRLSGTTSATAGAFRGAAVGTGFTVTGRTGSGGRSRSTTSETLANTLPLTVSRNLG